MPELPEVEVLAMHLAPSLKNKTIRGVTVRRSRVIAPTSETELAKALQDATFTGLSRRGKYLLFTLRQPHRKEPLTLVGHLGMTGRMYLLPKNAELPKHAAVVFDLGKEQFVFEDTRYFGRLTLDQRGISGLGPEPFGNDFTDKYFAASLKKSAQAIKIKLLDQTIVAGVGNIYASEALFRAGISPRLAAKNLSDKQVKRLRQSIQKVLAEAIRRGSTLPLDFAGSADRDGLFYCGSGDAGTKLSDERFFVYDRNGKPCLRCGTGIRRFVQAARSTYYCPHCQRS